MTDWAKAVLDASELLAAEPPLDEEEVVSRLQERGLSDAEARIAAAMVPIAFGRVLLSESGITRLRGTFHAPDEEGNWRAFELGRQPAFEEATRLAVTARHRGTIERDAYARIAARSVEVETGRDEPAPIAVAGVPLSMFVASKPWWKFW